jgi:glycogen phosphorylase
MNGVINLSILDGWWDEGYQADNGWAIKPASPELDPHRRDREESRTLYEILQDRVIPLYYSRGNGGYSPEWLHMAKRSMASLLPRYDASRMLGEYIGRFYLPAATQGKKVAERGYEGARALAAWKARVRAAWPGVALRRRDHPPRRIQFGDTLQIDVAVALNGLAPQDVCVELLLARGLQDRIEAEHAHELSAAGALEDTGEHRFTLQFTPELAGRLDYRIRAYPRHELLAHRFELGLMSWL